MKNKRNIQNFINYKKRDIVLKKNVVAMIIVHLMGISAVIIMNPLFSIMELIIILGLVITYLILISVQVAFKDELEFQDSCLFYGLTIASMSLISFMLALWSLRNAGMNDLTRISLVIFYGLVAFVIYHTIQIRIKSDFYSRVKKFPGLSGIFAILGFIGVIMVRTYLPGLDQQKVFMIFSALSMLLSLICMLAIPYLLKAYYLQKLNPGKK